MRQFLSIGECMIEMTGGDGGHYQQNFAGDTLNTAFYARQALSADWQVSYFTALGDDIYSDRMLDFLAHQNIDTSAVRRIAGKRPGLYMIHQADGDRQVTYWRENAAARQLADDAAGLAGALEGADMVYFSGITLAILNSEARTRFLTAVRTARARGARTAFDPNIRPTLWSDQTVLRDALMAAATVSDIVLPTHADEAPVFGDSDAAATGARYLAAGAPEVIVKNGADPALIVTEKGAVNVPAIRVGNVVDATGAGDSFNGAYLAARLAGKPVEVAGRAGHEMAAEVIQHRGAIV